MAFAGTPPGGLILRHALLSNNQAGDPQFTGYEPKRGWKCPIKRKRKSTTSSMGISECLKRGLSSPIRYVRLSIKGKS